MLTKGHSGVFHPAGGKSVRATVTRVRGGNLFDLDAKGFPASETQMVSLYPGVTEHGYFSPDGLALADTPPVDLPALVPAPPPSVLIWPAYVAAAVALGVAMFDLLR